MHCHMNIHTVVSKLNFYFHHIYQRQRQNIMILMTKTKYQVSDAKCSNSSGCLRGSYLRKGHGRMTGEEDNNFYYCDADDDIAVEDDDEGNKEVI